MKTPVFPQAPRRRGGFSLVEILAAIAIIALITFLAIPNIVQIKQDSETHLAISRAEALNLAQAAFIQRNGRTQAGNSWTTASSAENRYQLLAPFLSFAPPTLAAYTPAGFTLGLTNSALPFKVPITGPDGAISY